MESLGDVVGVWAHPDDETFLMAGIMAAGVRAGNRVVCVTATRGEGGIQDEARWPAAQLAAIRTTELERALDILGVTEHVWLDLPDGGCRHLHPDPQVERIAHILRDAQADTVLTFGPDGMTGHPDHIAVSEWTAEAFRREAKPGARLLYATVTPEWFAEFGPRWQSIGAFMTEDELPLTPADELALHFSLPQDLLDLKFKALRVQESQSASTISLLGEEWLRRDMTDEMFRLGERA